MKKKHINILINLLIILVSIYIIRVLKLTGICCIFLSILSPLFFGYVISWIIEPIVDKLKTNRTFATILVYLLFIGLLVLLLINIVPLIIEQSKNIYPIIKYYVLHNETLYSIYKSLNIQKIISTGFKSVNDCLNNVVGIVMNIVYSLIFGFYFLVSKSHNYFKFIPFELRKSVNKDLRLYVKSIVFDTLFMFGVLSLIFSIIGLNYPLLFALLCAITNIIPYIGPYLGGVPAILVGLSTSLRFGIIVAVTIIIVQTVENVVVQPLIVSKNVDLNPILILISIIIFSHFFGILGMIISTPVVLILRNIILYYKKNKPKWLILVLGKL